MSLQSNDQTENGERPTAPSLAGKALTFIAQYGLPPTPKVYEVAFRHFEGDQAALSDELSSRSEDPKRIDLQLMESLHAQYCLDDSSEDQVELGCLLSEELADLKSIIEDQQDAGVAYSESLDNASRVLATAEPQVALETTGSLAAETKRMHARLQAMRERLLESEEKVEELQRELSQSQSLMMTDPLSGLGNRRFYDSSLRRAIKSLGNADGNAEPYLALVDCDKFKAINDRFGHPCGDEVIRRIASTLKDVLPNAAIARLGGDEFAIFGRFPSIEDVQQFADDLKTKIGSLDMVHLKTQESLGRLKVSIGIARVRPNDNEETWHERADSLLYKAKELGGDRAMIERSLSV